MEKEEDALVAPEGDGGEQAVVRRNWWFQMQEVNGWVKTTSLRVVSATTASFFLVLLFLATFIYSHGIDLENGHNIEDNALINIIELLYNHLLKLLLHLEDDESVAAFRFQFHEFELAVVVYRHPRC
ncbi:hypothetical protein V2J09_005097 [Rumex salicifolius]